MLDFGGLLISISGTFIAFELLITGISVQGHGAVPNQIYIVHIPHWACTFPPSYSFNISSSITPSYTIAWSAQTTYFFRNDNTEEPQIGLRAITRNSTAPSPTVTRTRTNGSRIHEQIPTSHIKKPEIQTLIVNLPYRTFITQRSQWIHGRKNPRRDRLAPRIWWIKHWKLVTFTPNIQRIQRTVKRVQVVLYHGCSYYMFVVALLPRHHFRYHRRARTVQCFSEVHLLVYQFS